MYNSEIRELKCMWIKFSDKNKERLYINLTETKLND